MSDALDRHVDALVGYHDRLAKTDIAPDVVGALTVDFQKALFAGAFSTELTKDDVQAAAKAKAERRAEILGKSS